MSILTYHSEDGEVKYPQLTQALKEANVSNIAKEVENVRKSGKVRADGLTNDLLHKFKKVADWLLMEVYRSETESRRGFVPSDSFLSEVSTQETKLESIAIETWKLANTHTIKFHQKYKDIPVYGAQVNVEIDEENELLAINSTIGIPINDIDKKPRIKLNELKDLIQKKTNNDDFKNSDLTFTLYYYFDSTQYQDKDNNSQDGQWRLVYLVQNQIKMDKIDDPKMFQPIQKMVDYVVDAHTGELVSELSRLKTIRSEF